MSKSGYTEWCEARGVSHAHCPYGCEHPQPFVIADGTLLCGKCASLGDKTPMVPCTPSNCAGEIFHVAS